MRKEHFLEQRKSKLQLQGDGPFHVLERINDNVYKLDLSSEYNNLATFDVYDLSLFDASTNSRSNLFKEGRDDVIQGMKTSSTKDPMIIEEGPMTRSQTKQIKEMIGLLFQSIMDETSILTSKRQVSCWA